MSYDLVREKVPGFLKRVGDRAIFGSNNSLIVLGTDRAGPADAPIDSGYGHVNAQGSGIGAGSCHIIVGRSGQNPNFDTDSSYIYLSMKTDADDNLGLSAIESPSNATPAAIVKSDSIRFVGRNDMKISVGETYGYFDSRGTIVLQSPKILFGTNASHPLVRGDSFMATFNAFVDKFNMLVSAFNAHIHQDSGVGAVTTPPLRPGAVPPPIVPPPPSPPLFAPVPPGFGSSAQTFSHMPQTDLSDVSKTK